MEQAVMYWKIMQNSMRTAKAWKAAVVFQLILRCIMLFATVAVWHSLYASAGAGAATGAAAGATAVTASGTTVTLQETVTYMVITSLLQLVLSSPVIRLLHQRIISGDIALDLLKPVNTMLNYFSQTAGENAVRFLTQVLPFATFCIVIFPVIIPSLQNFLLFCAAALLAMVLNFLIFYTFGLTGFWHLSVNHVDFFLRNLLGFFSGSFIPLWFFPDFLASATGFLPFKYLYHVPASIFLNRLDPTETALALAMQGFWILLLLALQKLSWHFGIRKLVIQGG